MAERRIDLTIDPAMAYRVADLAREYQTEDMAPADDDGWEVDTDPGDDPISSAEDLIDAADESDVEVDGIEQELQDVVAAFNIDAKSDLLALILVGRGDFSADDWSLARRQARESVSDQLATYIEETPLVSDYLVEALEAMGYPQSDFE